MNLRKGVTYHSGREFTADDVVWNLQRALDPKVTVGILGGFFGKDPTFSARDKYTVVLQTAQPWPTVFDMFHVVNMLDKENTTSTQCADQGGRHRSVRLSGVAPGRVHAVHQEPQLLAIRQAIPGRSPGQRPHGCAGMVADLESGAARPGLQRHLQDFMRLKSDPSYTAQLLTPAAGMYQIQPNVTFKPLDDKRVRQALNYAIDRKRITDTVLARPGRAPGSALAGQLTRVRGREKQHLRIRPRQGQGAPQSAGVSNLVLDFVYAPTLPEYGTIAEIFQADLAKIGVTMNVKSMDIAALFDADPRPEYNGVYTLNDSWAAMEPVEHARRWRQPESAEEQCRVPRRAVHR